uniref:Uncharacterized protein n=1 Tax=Anguilla anguilla TaxID=7936 RepID=A0A0E9X0D9_ANGAN
MGMMITPTMSNMYCYSLICSVITHVDICSILVSKRTTPLSVTSSAARKKIKFMGHFLWSSVNTNLIYVQSSSCVICFMPSISCQNCAI